MIKVSNIEGHNGKSIPNQFIITTKDGELFQSYESAIALIDNQGVVHLSEHWKYSPTTSKYRALFLNEDTATTQSKIDSGEYLTDLTINGEVNKK